MVGALSDKLNPPFLIEFVKMPSCQVVCARMKVLECSGRVSPAGENLNGAFFGLVKSNATGDLEKFLTYRGRIELTSVKLHY